MKKKAEDLKPGDVIPGNEAYGPRVVFSAGPSSTYPLMVAVRFFGLWANAIDEITAAKRAEFEVESPALSPAQQHAEEMVDIMRTIVQRDFSPSVLIRDSEALLARIDPPKPPSVEELLAALAKLAQGHSVERAKVANGLLDRARAAGQLKGGQQ